MFTRISATLERDELSGTIDIEGFRDSFNRKTVSSTETKSDKVDGLTKMPFTSLLNSSTG